MPVLKKSVTDLIIQGIKSVVEATMTRWEGGSISGWKIKVYRVGTYYRCDIFPPDHAGGK